MSIAHIAIDACMGFICLLWLIQHLTEQTRRQAKRRNRRTGLPVPQCQRVPGWQVHAPMWTRRETK